MSSMSRGARTSPLAPGSFHSVRKLGVVEREVLVYLVGGLSL